MRTLSNVLITGGAGFIGSNFIRHLFSLPDFTGKVINVDKLTYAGNPDNLEDIEELFGGNRYFFEKVDICDFEKINQLFPRYSIDTVVHFAAESHVDRSIFGPKDFIRTNIVGTFTLLESARLSWRDRKDVLFHHVSTDEVFGSLGSTGLFTETTPYDPKSPYSASKASSDHLVRAYHHTYGLPTTISNCSNNFGPRQFPEKMIPLMILNLLEEKPLPVYGDGQNIRDWLYVGDHSIALWLILTNGKEGQTYNIGGDNEWKNIDLVHILCEKIAELRKKDKQSTYDLITFVKDRPGHDRRYAIDCNKIKQELRWKQQHDFAENIDSTILWYRDNMPWVEKIRSGEYKNWIAKNYLNR